MTLHERELDRQLIMRLRENLLDENAVVDDIRHEFNVLPQRLRDAIERRDTTARELNAAIARWNDGRAA